MSFVSRSYLLANGELPSTSWHRRLGLPGDTALTAVPSQTDASLPPSRTLKPGEATAMAKFFDSLRETELAIAKRKRSLNAATSAMGRQDRRRTRRARVQIPLL